MKVEESWFYPPIVQSAIAGTANSQFCQQMLDFNAGMVILGGLSVDKQTKIATKKLADRGREEFLLPEKNSEIDQWCNNQISLKKNNNTQKIAANVRIVNFDRMGEFWFRKLHSLIDFFEINAHCRQKEIMDIGGGQNLLTQLPKLENLLKEIKLLFPLLPFGLKVRGYIIEDIRKVVDLLERTNCKYIHVDAMLPGINSADLQLVRNFVELTDIPIIGNNQVRSVNDIEKMLSTGAKAVSIARPLIENPKFMKQLTKKFVEEY
jgi:TIM-barrel protein